MKKFAVKTLGCKANFADGQILDVRLSERGFSSTAKIEEADFVIVNSCTVTDEADKQSKKLARDIARKNPNTKVIYTGCGAEVNPLAASQVPGISAVLGNQDKGAAAQLIEKFLLSESASDQVPLLGGVSEYTELASRHPIDREWNLPESSLDEVVKLTSQSSSFRTRAFVKVQEGCNSFCTYCIIPYGRGPSRSLPIETIVEKVRELVAQGIQEIILTGTNIGDYGMDWKQAYLIDDLIEALLTQSGIKRLRVSSLDPTEISDRLIQIMETHENFCPHFHVSLQNASSKILKLMKRKYTYEAVETCLGKLGSMKRKPFIGMDYITGFPGETESDFLESVEKLKSLYWQRLHVFPYSERSSTPATKLPNSVPQAIRKQRAKVLQALSLERLTRYYADTRQQFNASEGFLRNVLLENPVKGPDGTRDWISGYTPQYQRVIVHQPFLNQTENKADKKTEKKTEPRQKNPLHNQIVDIKVSNWLVDRAGGEVSWIGSLA